MATGDLAARLEAMRARRVEAQRAAECDAVRTALAPLAERLHAAGEPFEIVSMHAVHDWMPRWIGWGWGEIPWHLARTPHLEKPGLDAVARAAAAAPMLAALVDGDAPVLFVYEDLWVAVRVSPAAAIAHMAALMAVDPLHGEMWIVAPPPRDVIIRVDGEWVISHVAMPLAAEKVARQRIANRDGRRALAPLRRALVQAGVRARLHYAHDLEHARAERLGPPVVDWAQEDKALDCAVPGDPAAAGALLRDFVAARTDPDAMLRIILPGGVPQLHIPARTLDRAAEPLVAACPGPFWLAGEGPGWLVQFGPVWIYARG